jgi:hypothetical protein
MSKDVEQDVRQIFFGEGTEPITDELIKELVEKGFPRNDLLYLKNEGAMYSRPRNSFIFPPEFEAVGD